MFTDLCGRSISYLRLSLTKACQLRCTYCRPQWLRNPVIGDVLTPAEIATVVTHLARNHSLRKVRLTGGDPSARADLIHIIERIATIPGIKDIAMSTHGLTLARRANDYASAGLQRVNISLDTLDRNAFARITGVDGLSQVVAGIDAAIGAGLTPIKLNVVVMRDENMNELPALVEFALERGCEIRFIELMPMGPLASRWRNRFVSAAEMRLILDPIVDDWQPLTQLGDSARCFRIRASSGREGIIGFITPMSCNFCAACSRIRMDAEGVLYPCLMDRPAGSLMSAIRPRFCERRFDETLSSALRMKKEVHPHDGFVAMTHIGG